MFGEVLGQVAEQLGAVQPPEPAERRAGARPAATPDAPGAEQQKTLLQRLQERAPSSVLSAYVEGRLDLGRLQRSLPEQLDQNMRLLSILAAEMQHFVRRLEQLADAAAAELAADSGAKQAAGGGQGGGGSAAAGGDEEALLRAAVADGLAKETRLVVSGWWWGERMRREVAGAGPA